MAASSRPVKSFKTVTMSTLLTSTAVTAATQEEVATVRCTNSKEAIKYEKDLHAATEAALKCLQKGSDATEDVELKDIMPNLIKYFKTKMKILFKPAEKTDRMVVLESISDAEAHCIWDTLEDPEESEEEISVQQEEDGPKFMNWVEFLQSVDEDLTEDQTKQIVQLFKSHRIMLEHQAQVTQQLGELSQTLSPKMFLLILQSSVQPMYQLSIPEKFMPKFTLPKKKPSRDEKIIRKILLDSGSTHTVGRKQHHSIFGCNCPLLC